MSGAYAAGAASGPSTIGAGRGLPLDSTLTPVWSISVTDRLEVVATVSPLDSG
jgi:hypothetical protein